MDSYLLEKKNKSFVEDKISSKTALAFKNFYDTNFEKLLNSKKRNKYYYDLNHKSLLNRIPKGLKVLDIGCGTGELLSKLKPSYGIGVDLSSKNITYAQEKYADENLNFIEGDIYSEPVRKELKNKKFDAIILLNTVAQVHDVIELFKLLHEYCHRTTKIYIYNYSRLWQPFCFLADLCGIRVKHPVESWIPPEELNQMFYHADLQKINQTKYLLFPFNFYFISDFLNNFFARLPILEELCLMNGFVLRPVGEKYKNELPKNPTHSVVIPCRNEAGHIFELIERLPVLSSGSEYIFVEGNSTDNTEEVICSVIRDNPQKPFKFIKQKGIGKGDAVREGFASAKGDILSILDADITVSPEDLPKFTEILLENKADFVNGSRMVYPMETKAMKFLNLLANKFFAMAFTFLLGQQVRDTLCGTKVLWKKDYEEIVKNRSYFGDFDPFGDFDLIFGASKLGLKIIDLPVRYGERTYGETNISRFRHGWLLLRMTIFAFKKIKMV